MPTLPPIHKYLPLIVGQSFGQQELARVPEPDPVTDQPDHVLQYDEVMSTKLAIAYALGFEIIYRTRVNLFGGNAIDLACGPGHFTLLLAQGLKLDSICGCDLSEGMIQVAKKNALSQRQGEADFRVSNVLDLSQFSGDQFDVSTFADAAHHLHDLVDVARVVAEMDRITRPDGLVAVMDLARLKTAALTESYLCTVGGDYSERGLPAFYRDFQHSMYAAWTVEELSGCVPQNAKRDWYQIVPIGLPTIQIILGLPLGRRRVYLRRFGWHSVENPVGVDMRWEWRLARQSLLMGRARRLVGN